jgi:MscS family membrane protein
MHTTLAEFNRFVRQLATNDFRWLLDFIKKYAWAMECIVILFITLVLSYCEHVVYNRLHPRFVKAKRQWQSAILHALHKPFLCLIWLMGVTLSIDLIAGYVPHMRIFEIGPILRKIGVVLLLLWCTISFIHEIEKILLIPKEGKFHLDKTTVRALGQVLRIVVIGTGVFVVLQTTLGIGASGIMAFAGGGGIVIGWAAKDMLANVFGGFMIFLDRPFVIGDRIISVNKEIDGHVEYIGWRLTRIRTLDKVPVYVPNSFFSSMSIENPSRITHRRMYATMGLRYSDVHKIPQLLVVLNQALKQNHELDPLEGNYVRLVNCGESSLEILICAFTKTTDLEEFYKVRENIFISILTTIEEHGLACAYPTTAGTLTVHLQQ